MLIGIGLLFSVGNLHIAYFRELLALLAGGPDRPRLVKLVDSEHGGSRAAGGVLFGVGAIFLAQNPGILRTWVVRNLAAYP